ncbi:MAG TPA: quinone-dependent dihydroorotate dehydrogenase [Candidatus Paceibacterota bacterium]|nr:quinone-dependent dihydroorotate dehydrogenase [Candidatus Paceibacterota bacterium]
MYERILKPIFFKLDPERVHDFFVEFGHMLGNFRWGRAIVSLFCRYDNPALHTEVLGIKFRNPIGLAAGFDKDVNLTNIMPAVGFGFMEVGAVTRWPYEGNQGLRLARLPADQSLIVYYGLKNIGAEAVESKIRHGLKFTFPVGLNIAKTNRADIKGKRSVEDYIETYRMLASYFSYVTINVSCPNAQDGCTFQDPAMLDDLLGAFSHEKKHCPIFIKISTHLTTSETSEIVAVVNKYPFVDGFVVGNLSKRRHEIDFKSSPEELNRIPNGGISGKPVKDLSTNLIRHIYKSTGGRYTIIGLGGIFTADDAYEKIKAGASLVQIITGLIYGGPLAVKRIKKGLVKLLQKDGYTTISEAVGKE